MKITITEFFNGAYLIFLVLLIAMFSIAQAKEIDSSENIKKSGLTMLGLIAYNYTDRTIASYQINGAGGGDVSLSSLTSGGSGTTCCVQYEMLRKAPIHVLVRWQENGCYFQVKSQASEYVSRQTHYYFKEKEVMVDLMHNGNPTYIETHFYPDGDVRVRITDEISLPQIKLSGRRPDKSNFNRCKNGKKPKN